MEVLATYTEPSTSATRHGESQGRSGEEDLGTELHSQEFPISRPAVNQKFTPKITYKKDLHTFLALEKYDALYALLRYVALLNEIYP